MNKFWQYGARLIRSLPAKRRVGEQKNYPPLACRQQPLWHEAASFNVLVP